MTDYDLKQISTAILHAIHAPVTDANLLFMRAWHACEGGSAAFNPFNTTLWQPGCSNYNSFGPHGAYHVRDYPDMTTGVRATALTIENGHYPHVLEALRAGRDPYAPCTGPGSHELDLWGTGGAHIFNWLFAHHAGHDTPAHKPAGHPAHTVYLVHAGDTLSEIAARYHVRGGWEAIYKANAHVIGSDPDMIRPGERLVIP